MSEVEYPILIERYRGDQSLTIVCERCHAERVIDGDEIRSEDIYECPADTELSRKASTAPRCRGYACMKYVEGDRCKGCNALGFFHDELSGCCSRACMLQAEYADQLAVQREHS